MKKTIVFFSLMLFTVEQVQAQACCVGATLQPQSNISPGNDKSYADVGIDFSRTKVDETSPTQLKLTAVIQNKNGNNSTRETVAIIQLPGEAEVISFKQIPAAGAVKKVTMVQCGGILICNIDSLDPSTGGWAVGQTEVTIEVITTKPTKAGTLCQANFGILVYSKLPDSYLDNNTWKWHTDAQRAALCGR